MAGIVVEEPQTSGLISTTDGGAIVIESRTTLRLLGSVMLLTSLADATSAYTDRH
jgi:hypothetical protein